MVFPYTVVSGLQATESDCAWSKQRKGAVEGSLWQLRVTNSMDVNNGEPGKCPVCLLEYLFM